MIQNAVDAIRQSDIPLGRIELDIDCPARAITIADNGIGINVGDLPHLLKPFATNKTDNDITIGEKGVGLKFVMFASNYFYIKSGNSSGTAEALICDACNWKKSTHDQQLSLKHKVLDEKFLGTKVEVRGVDNETIFNLSLDQLVYVLRTRTAMGTTLPIWGDDKEIEIYLRYKNVNGNILPERLVPFRYALLIDQIPANSQINLDDFETWLQEGDRTDQEKMGKLRDKIIHKSGQYWHSNQRIIKYFACFVPKRSVWNELSVQFNLANKEQLSDDGWLQEYDFCKLNNGIFVSVKGMPTGISVDHPTTGYSGYWPNFFILFEDSFTRFDIGRKSIHGRQAGIHREYAKQIFNMFLPYITKYVSGDIVVEPSEWNRDDVFTQIDRLIDLDISGLKFKKAPSDQEASVVAIFFECIGSGKIRDIIPLSAGYRSKYDLYALWNNKRIVVEFKSRLSNLAKDFDDARKMFNHFNCVVCWEVTDKDKQVLRDMGIAVEEIVPSIFGHNPQKIPHSTHTLSLGAFVEPIYVIDLKKLLTSAQS